MKHPSDEQLILYEYGESPNRAAVEGHLAECDRCRAEWATLHRILELVGSFPVPEQPEGYGAEVWQRLAPRLRGQSARPERRVLWPWFFGSRWALGVTAAALVLIAFLSGRFWPRRTVPPLQAVSEQARNRIMLAAVVDHFERAEILLTALKHAQAESGRQEVDISFEQELAEDLLAGNRIYEQSAMHASRDGLASVLDELGRVLVMVANAPATVSRDDLATLRQGIQQQAILFKLQVLDDCARASKRNSRRATSAIRRR
jgi:hypothetical protein